MFRGSKSPLGVQVLRPHYQQLSLFLPPFFEELDRAKWMMFISKDEGSPRNETILCSLLPLFATIPETC